MNAWVIYTLLVLLTGAIGFVAYLFFKSRQVGKKEEFDATRDLFI